MFSSKDLPARPSVRRWNVTCLLLLVTIACLRPTTEHIKVTRLLHIFSNMYGKQCDCQTEVQGKKTWFHSFVFSTVNTLIHGRMDSILLRPQTLITRRRAKQVILNFRRATPHLKNYIEGECTVRDLRFSQKSHRTLKYLWRWHCVVRWVFIDV